MTLKVSAWHLALLMSAAALACGAPGDASGGQGANAAITGGSSAGTSGGRTTCCDGNGTSSTVTTYFDSFLLNY